MMTVLPGSRLDCGTSDKQAARRNVFVIYDFSLQITAGIDRKIDQVQI